LPPRPEIRQIFLPAPVPRRSRCRRKPPGNARVARSKAAEGRRTPKRWCEGRARHSVRAGVVNPDASVGSRRHAEDCAPYQRFVWKLAPRLACLASSLSPPPAF
jgi:hypothetical protein